MADGVDSVKHGADREAPAQGLAVDRGLFGALPPTLEWVGGADGVLRLVDQTQLPLRVEMRDCTTVEQVWEAIRTLRVRGAPAIGVAGAYGLCLGMRPFRDQEPPVFLAKLREVADYLCSARPTAVNLSWAVRRVGAVATKQSPFSIRAAWEAMLAEAHAIAREDAEVCRRIGEIGAHLVPEGGGVLTHCNAGALATVAYGTALSLLYVAHQRGRRFRVFADETRPLLQGARLTAFELHAAGIDVTVLCDNAAASLMQAGRVQLIVVGADRIAANGDTANKIGTYGLAILAQHHRIPFYVAAPLSTFDLSMPNGGEIPIEQRPAEEVGGAWGRPVVPLGVPCYNPAFDVTPAALITGIVSEMGIVEPVTEEKIRAIFQAKGCNRAASP
jgi:methylthioribose-1-phosphate isomerase